jgi:hypothetical protein
MLGLLFSLNASAEASAEAPVDKEKKEAVHVKPGENEDRVRIGLYGGLSGSDIMVTMRDGKKFRVLVPEFISGHNGVTHVLPVKWKKDAKGGLSGMMKLPSFMDVSISLRPGEYYIDMTLAFTNRSSRIMKNLSSDICMDFKASQNTDFIPKVASESRSESGEYFFSKVAGPGALVFQKDKWVTYDADKKSRRNSKRSLDIPVLICKSPTSKKVAFQMWSRPLASNPWINYENACMHLMPTLGDSLGVGKTIALRGKAGISPNGIEKIMTLYKSMGIK